jgi:APA family basic amino acid/polyamine antiporter
VRWGKLVQNIFTVAKLIGIVLSPRPRRSTPSSAIHLSCTSTSPQPGILKTSPASEPSAPLPASAWSSPLCVSQTGSLFSADSWHDITFVAGEVRNPQRNLPLALGIGTSLVIALYLLCNLCYLAVLPMHSIQTAADDRVATLVVNTVLPGIGKLAMGCLIMVSTFGTVNALTLAGGRACYAMAQDGLFFRRAGTLNKAQVPGWALALQCLWSLLPRLAPHLQRRHPHLRQPLQQPPRLRHLRRAHLLHPHRRRPLPSPPHPAQRPSDPIVAGDIPGSLPLYILGASFVLIILFAFRTATTWPGLLIVLSGVPVYALLRRGASRHQSSRANAVRSL